MTKNIVKVEPGVWNHRAAAAGLTALAVLTVLVTVLAIGVFVAFLSGWITFGGRPQSGDGAGDRSRGSALRRGERIVPG